MPAILQAEVVVPYEYVDNAVLPPSSARGHMPSCIEWLSRNLPQESSVAYRILFGILQSGDQEALAALEAAAQASNNGKPKHVEVASDIRSRCYMLVVVVTVEPRRQATAPTVTTAPIETGLKEPQARRLNFRGLKSISPDGRKAG